MNNPFEIIKYLLGNKRLTSDEKRRMKMTLVSYVSIHPVKSGLLSPYTFRYMGVALASLVLVLGGSIGLTSASYQALPNSKLYPLKIWIEEYQAKNQKTPDTIIAFETKRIETRFNEATRLAINQQLDDTTSSIIQAGIEHSRTLIKETAESIQATRPEVALIAATNLETTFSSNGKILAAIEQNTNQNIGPIVLAAQVTTKKLALEKTKFEEIVASKPNESTETIAKQRIEEVSNLLTALPEEALPPIIAPQEPVALSEPSREPSEFVINNEPTISLMKTTVVASAPLAEKTPREQANDLISSAQKKMDAGLYSEALIDIEKARQIITEINLTDSLEKTYQVETAN